MDATRPKATPSRPTRGVVLVVIRNELHSEVDAEGMAEMAAALHRRGGGHDSCRWALAHPHSHERFYITKVSGR